MHYRPLTLPAMAVVAAGLVLGMPAAHADGDNNTLVPNNKRLNDGVVANVYTVQHQAGCANDIKINPQLQLAAQRQQWKAVDGTLRGIWMQACTV